jgi:hypothetical protein
MVVVFCIVRSLPPPCTGSVNTIISMNPGNHIMVLPLLFIAYIVRGVVSLGLAYQHISLH